jgi:hypothetical protein
MRLRAQDAATKPLQFRLHLQNASRCSLESSSNQELRKMLRDPEVLDWLETALASPDEEVAGQHDTPGRKCGVPAATGAGPAAGSPSSGPASAESRLAEAEAVLRYYASNRGEKARAYFAARGEG